MKTKFTIIVFLLSIVQLYAQVPTLKQENNLYALVNPQGKVVSEYYNAVYDFEAGIAIVRSGTKFGAIDKSGKIVIPVSFAANEIKPKIYQYIEEFVRNNPENAEAKAYLKALAKKKKAEEAEEAKKKEVLADVLTKKASNLFQEKEYEKAILIYNEIITLKPTDKYAYGNAGLSYRILQNYTKAEEYLIKSIEIDNEYIWAINQLSFVYSATNQYTKAYELAKKLVRLEDDNYSHYFNLSFYALFVKKPGEAIEAALKSIDLAPDETAVNTNLALAYVLNNEYEKAKQIYLEWKDKKFPDDDRLAKEVFLQDIKDLEEAGISHPDFKKVKELLEK